MAKLQKGQKAILTCPPDYAYGARGYPPVIPPNSTLKFEVEVLDFSVPILCSHILIKHKDSNKPVNTRKNTEIKRTKEEALKTVGMLIDSIKKGQDFAKVAAAFSECPSGNNEGSLGIINKGQMVPAFEEVAFKLEIDEVSDAVETPMGYHIIKRFDTKEYYEMQQFMRMQ